MSLNWKNIDRRLETGLIFLCCIVGIGSILFGSLSGSNYGYHFIVIGILALILVLIHKGKDGSWPKGKWHTFFIPPFKIRCRFPGR